MKDKIDMTIETYNNVVKEYVAYYDSKDMQGVQFQKEIDFVVSELKNSASILDVGTGIGSYPQFLTEKIDKNFKLVGIDASENMIEVAKKNATKAEFKVMDIRDLIFNEESFDAILCLALVHHIDDNTCLSALNKFDKILNTNGLIVINTHELRPDDIKESIEVEPLNPKYSTYFNRYTKDFFIDYFNKNNYEIVKFFDNPMFNSETIGEKFCTVNQFSIIARKK